MASSFSTVFLLLFLAIAPDSDVPRDLLSIIGPEDGLTILGETTTDANLRRLIRGESAPTAAPNADGKLDKEIESAIQNLASSSAKIRENARKKIIAGGAGVVPRIKEIAENDVRRSAEAKKILAKIADVAVAKSADRSIAQIFAMRLAAEKKLKAVVPDILEVAKSSKSPFVKDAAQDALARLVESATKTVEARAPLSLRTIRALSGATNLLLAIDVKTPPPGKSGGFTVGTMFDSFKSMLGENAPPDFDAEKTRMMTQLLGFVRSYGNMRLDRVVVANAGKIDQTGGGLGIVLHGMYEPAVLRSTLDGNTAQWRTTQVSETTVYNSPFLRIVLLDDRSVLLLPVMASNRFPLAEYLANYRAERDGSATNARLAQFVKTLEKPFIARGIAITNDALMKEILAEFQGSPLGTAVGGMKELELSVVDSSSGGHLVRFEGLFDKTESASTLATFVTNSAKSAQAELEGLLAQQKVPVIESALKMMKSVKTSAEAKRGILRVDVPKMKVTELFTGMFGVSFGG